MSLRRLLLAPTLVVLGACSSDPGTSSALTSVPSESPTPTASATAGTKPEAVPEGGAKAEEPPQAAGSDNSSRGGAGAIGTSDAGAGKTNTAGKTANNAGEADSPDSSDDDSDQTGEDTTPPPTSSEPPAPPPTCQLNDTCTSHCGAEQATCGVESTESLCEFIGFTGATAEVACGERVIVGTACCGGCGCVPVELFFDGTRCWQGIPTCDVASVKNRLFDPHSSTVPNPSFVPNGPFYLGNGGIGGGETTPVAAGGTTGSDAGAGNDAGNASVTSNGGATGDSSVNGDAGANWSEGGNWGNGGAGGGAS